MGSHRNGAAGKGELQTNDFTLSMGGVGGGVATEGPVILSDLLIPSALSQYLHWRAFKVDTWAIYRAEVCLRRRQKTPPVC